MALRLETRGEKMKISKTNLKKLIREELDKLLEEELQDLGPQSYEVTALTNKEKDQFAEQTGLGDILRIYQELKAAGDEEAARAIAANVAERLKDFADPVMLARLEKGRRSRGQ